MMRIRNDLELTARPLASLLLLAAFVAGCGDGETMVDAGPERDGGAPPDLVAPTLLSTDPEDATLGVARDADLVATFSEAMIEGTVTVRVEGEAFDADVSLDGARVTVSATDGWPMASEVEVRFGDDFTDLDGNAVPRAYVTRFTTADDGVPTVLDTVPADGATDVSVRLGAVRIQFSEPMDQGAGTVSLEAGDGTLDGAAALWSAQEIVIPITGLVHDADYRIALTGFRDRAGNAADLSSLEGALEFHTRADDEAPRLLSSSVAEGQVDVLLESLSGVVTLTFDEPMDPSVTTVSLSVDGAAQAVDVTWTDASTAEVSVAGVARTEAEHSLDLTTLRDVAGNLLDPAPRLGDGHLDFTTGVDRFVPYVAASTPLEGATDVPLPFGGVLLAFSEAMDSTITELTLTDDLGRTSTVNGTWQRGDTVLSVDAAAFVPGRTYQVDTAALRDLSGTAVSTAHPYLGDGQLDFALATPTGESCDFPLLPEHANEVVAGRYTFEITRAQRTRNNGSGACDPNGIAETDAVIHYHKSTPDLSDPAGAALRVLTFNVSNRVNVDVLAGVCDPQDPAAASARQVCMTGHDSVDQFLDLPAGDYYIWVSTADGSPLDIDVAVEEVPAIPEGEACGDPYDSTSATYTAPGGPEEPHVWDLPSGPGNSLDIATMNLPGAAFSCDDEPFGDVVVQYDKVGADTVVDVSLIGTGGGFAAEMVSGVCRPDMGGVRGACDSFVGTSVPERFTVAAPAGPVFIWLAGTSSSQPFRGAHVEVRELPAPTVPGSSCATAIPVTAGTSVAITPDHTERYFGPSCIDSASNVTWYAFDTTAGVTQVRTTGIGSVGLVDGTSQRELGCSADATTLPLTRFAPVGTRLCVGVESASGITGLTIDSLGYDGPGVGGAVRLDVAPPNLDGTLYAGFSITGDSWLAATPTTFFQNMGTAGLISAPVGGSTQASIRFDVDGRVLGQSAVAVGERLYSMEQSSSGPRFFRLTNASGAFDPEVMDPGADYPEHTYALAYDGTHFYTMVREGTASTARDFPIYELDADVPSAPVVVGRFDTIYQTAGLAATPSHFFLSGATSSSASTRGIYRLDRTQLDADSVTTPTLILPLSTLGTSGAPMRLYTSATETYLYVRDSGGRIHVVADPAGAATYLGVVFETSSADYGFDIEPVSGSMYVFGTHEDYVGDWYRLDP